jgi:hypothetical protein
MRHIEAIDGKEVTWLSLGPHTGARVVAQKKYERCFSPGRKTGGVPAGTSKDTLFVSTTFY